MNIKADNKYANLRRIINKFRLKKIKIESINKISDSLTIQRIDQDNISVSPEYINCAPYISKYPVVDVKILHLRDVFCNINSSSYINQNRKIIYMEEFPYIDRHKASYASGFIHSHDNDFAYIKRFNRKKVHKYNNVFFLGGNGSFNFYHWMIEIVPKLLLLNNSYINKYDIDTIVVNNCVEINDNYMYLLKQCLNHLDKINIVYVNQSDIFFVKNLFFMNTFNHTVYNFKSMNNEYCLSTIYNNEVLDSLKIRLDIKDIKDKCENHKNIFILRDEKAVSEFNKRNYNQSEVFEFFQKKGFIGLYLGDFTLAEQAHFFRNADFIIGPSGASWSNLIFCKDGTKAISWLPESIAHFDTYSTLAYLREVEIRFVKYKTADYDIHSQYLLNVQEIIDLYNSMI